MKCTAALALIEHLKTGERSTYTAIHRAFVFPRGRIHE